MPVVQTCRSNHNCS
jgi:hypothetical protein